MKLELSVSDAFASFASALSSVPAAQLLSLCVLVLSVAVLIKVWRKK